MIWRKAVNVLQSKDTSLWNNGVVLSFDLDTSKLRAYYSKTAPQGAYEVLKRFLLKNGFRHMKDSDYVNDSIDKVSTVKLLYRFTKVHKWFSLCVNKVNISPNVKVLDISEQIQQLADENWKRQKDKENQRAATRRKNQQIEI